MIKLDCRGRNDVSDLSRILLSQSVPPIGRDFVLGDIGLMTDISALCRQSRVTTNRSIDFDRTGCM